MGLELMAQDRIVTHYDNLKVARNAPVEVIRAAYRALAQQFHPDKNPNRELAEHRMRIINRAYEVLSDPDKRREHDAWISEQEALKLAEGERHPAETVQQPRATTRQRAENSEGTNGQDRGDANGASRTAGAQFDDASRFQYQSVSKIYRKPVRSRSWWKVGLGLLVMPFVLVGAGINWLLLVFGGPVKRWAPVVLISCLVWFLVFVSAQEKKSASSPLTTTKAAPVQASVTPIFSEKDKREAAAKANRDFNRDLPKLIDNGTMLTRVEARPESTTYYLTTVKIPSTDIDMDFMKNAQMKVGQRNCADHDVRITYENGMYMKYVVSGSDNYIAGSFVISKAFCDSLRQ